MSQDVRSREVAIRQQKLRDRELLRNQQAVLAKTYPGQHVGAYREQIIGPYPTLMQVIGAWYDAYPGIPIEHLTIFELPTA